MSRVVPFRIRVPGSTANLGAGFDCLGMAVTLHNMVEIRPAPPGKSGIQYVIVGEGATELSGDGKGGNLFELAMRKTLDELDVRHLPSLEIRMTNRIPLRRGLGSSGAAALAGIVAAYRIAGVKPEADAVLRHAVAIEGHPDNLVPSFVGGATAACTVGREVAWERVRIEGALELVAVVPSFEVSTKLAREVLPAKVPYADAVHNLGRACLLMAALGNGRHDLLHLGFEDRLHQPYRANLVPGFVELVREARKLGAAGAFLSGAGPTIMVLAPAESARGEASRRIGEGMARLWRRKFGVECDWRSLKMDRLGLRIEAIR